MRLYTTTVLTPIGPFTLVCDGESISAAGFTGRVEDLRISGHALAEVRQMPDLAEHSRAVTAYFEGDISAVDGVPVAQRGSAFHLAAWCVLRQIRPGQAISYRELAVRLGRPTASRAAGTACGRNAVAVIVPCHRVIRSDGGMGGFAWGLDRKRWLLAHEARSARFSPLREQVSAIYT